MGPEYRSIESEGDLALQCSLLIRPESVAALVAEIIQRVFSSTREGGAPDVLDIAATASSKLLRWSINSQALKDLSTSLNNERDE